MRSKSVLVSTTGDDEAMFNPQFRGIAKELNKSLVNRRRKQIEERKVSSRVNYLVKEEQLAKKALERKEREMEVLMEVLARKEADEARKQAQRQKKEEAIARQRELNMRKRNEHQQKLRGAYLSVYDDNHSNYQRMKKTFHHNRQTRKATRIGDLKKKQDRVMLVSLEHEMGRKRIQSFHRSRVDMFTNRYKDQINQQEEEEHRANNSILQLGAKEKELQLEIQRSTNRLIELENEYEERLRAQAGMSMSMTRQFNSSLTKFYKGRENQKLNEESDEEGRGDTEEVQPSEPESKQEEKSEKTVEKFKRIPTSQLEAKSEKQQEKQSLTVKPQTIQKSQAEEVKQPSEKKSSTEKVPRKWEEENREAEAPEVPKQQQPESQQAKEQSEPAKQEPQPAQKQQPEPVERQGEESPDDKESVRAIPEEKASSVNVEAKVSRLLEQEAADL